MAAAHKKETQPISEVTRHRSEANSSRPIRHKHKDQRTHMAAMHARKLGIHFSLDEGPTCQPHSQRGGRWATGPGRPNKEVGRRPMDPTAFHPPCGISLLAPCGGSRRKRPWLPPINTRGGGENEHTTHNTHHIHHTISSLEFPLE